MLSVSIYFFGVMISGIVFGSLSDRFGRRKIIMLTMYAHTILGVGVAFAPNYISFVIMRFLLGFFIEVSFQCIKSLNVSFPLGKSTIALPTRNMK